MTQVTEITDIEEVFGFLGNFLYVEYLVAVFDRDYRDPPAAKLIGTEKARVAAGMGGVLNITYHDPVTEAEIPSSGQQVQTSTKPDALVTLIRNNAGARIASAGEERKWRAERLYN